MTLLDHSKKVQLKSQNTYSKVFKFTNYQENAKCKYMHTRIAKMKDSAYQVLLRIWRNCNPHTILVRL